MGNSNKSTMLFSCKILVWYVFITFLNCFFTLPAFGQSQVLPSVDQVKWADAEIGVIIHLDINIYAPETFDYKDKTTLPDVNVFTPSKLNTDQWIRTAKAAGATYAVLTVKHGTGFCLWPSAVNNYNVGYTKWRNGKADILKEFIASCKKYGLKPGLYYNTNSNTYYGAGYKPFISDSAHKAYNKAVLAQLKEIWSNYGDVFEIWFDGGITNDNKFGIKASVMRLIYEKQPHAILFQGPADYKNIIRWVGNEDGIANYPQWSRSNATTSSDGVTSIDGLNGDSKGKIWCPAESDFPIRRNNAWNGGWLWHGGQDHEIFTVKELTDKYYKSVGRNTNMLVGMVVDTSGLIPKRDSLVFDSLGRTLRKLFNKPVFTAKNITKKITELHLPNPESISQVMIAEEIEKGENISSYAIDAMVNHRWQTLVNGQSVGHKRLQTFKTVKTGRMRFTVKSAAGKVHIKKLAFYTIGQN
jgi:alpha-L-fucosidase